MTTLDNLSHLEKLGKRLKQLRLEKDYTLKQVSDAIYYDISNLSKVERGIYDLSTENLIRVSKFYNVSPGYLLGIEENKHDINTKLDYIINKLEFDKWQSVIDFCKKEDLDSDIVLKLLKLVVEMNKNREEKMRQKENIKT